MKILTWIAASIWIFIFIIASMIGGGFLLHALIPAMSMFACIVMFTIISIVVILILLLSIIESAEM